MGWRARQPPTAHTCAAGNPGRALRPFPGPPWWWGPQGHLVSEKNLLSEERWVSGILKQQLEYERKSKKHTTKVIFAKETRKCKFPQRKIINLNSITSCWNHEHACHHRETNKCILQIFIFYSNQWYFKNDRFNVSEVEHWLDIITLFLVPWVRCVSQYATHDTYFGGMQKKAKTWLFMFVPTGATKVSIKMVWKS